MLIGRKLEVISKTESEVKVKVYLAGGGNTVVKIDKGSKITYLDDPRFGENSDTAQIRSCDFDEFCDNIEEDDDNYYFTDDLGYIQGIAVE